MAWFRKSKAPLPKASDKKVHMPEGLWTKCQNCHEIIYSKEIERNWNVCPKCDYHFRITSQERLDLVLDKDSFVEMDGDLKPKDFLDFKDSKKYRDRIKAAVKKRNINEAVICGEGTIHDLPVVVAVLDFGYMGGSMGSVVGEKITRAIEYAIDQQRPVIIFSSSGGVTASFAMLGNVNMAEPRALIGFAGPRVIEQTIRQELPEGFQRAEYLLEHGMVDMIVRRPEMKDKISQVLRMFLKS
jgi:acetyl-CoA carboxylase carboxyl transferase subunit beta